MQKVGAKACESVNRDIARVDALSRPVIQLPAVARIGSPAYGAASTNMAETVVAADSSDRASAKQCRIGLAALFLSWRSKLDFFNQFDDLPVGRDGP